MHGCCDGLAHSETSTWPAARAGSGDAALAPPLRRCLRCLRAQRCPNHPTQPFRVICCRFLLIVRSLSHPARCEGTASIPGAGKQAIPPAAQRQGRQMPAGMAWLLRRPGVLAGPSCAQHGTSDTFCLKMLTVHMENHKRESCDRAWHFPP